MNNRNTQAKPWTEKEFRLLLASGNLSDDETATRISRTPGAVNIVREGVKSWRKTGENKGQILSQIMIRILKAQGS